MREGFTRTSIQGNSWRWGIFQWRSSQWSNDLDLSFDGSCMRCFFYEGCVLSQWVEKWGIFGRNNPHAWRGRWQRKFKERITIFQERYSQQEILFLHRQNSHRWLKSFEGWSSRPWSVNQTTHQRKSLATQVFNWMHSRDGFLRSHCWELSLCIQSHE